MKRIAAGVLSLGMLAVTSTKANYGDDGMRRHHTGEGSTWVGHRHNRSSFQQGYRYRTSGSRDEREARRNSGMHRRTNPRYEGHMYGSDVVGSRYQEGSTWEQRHQGRVSDRRERWNEGYVGKHGTWLGKGNAPNLPGIEGQNPEDMAKQQYQQY